MLTSFEVTGKITDASNNPCPGLTIQVFDSDNSWYEDHNDDLVGMDKTKNDGTFKVTFLDYQFKEFLERNPDLYLVIRRDDGRILQKTEVRREVKAKDNARLNFEVRLAPQEKKDPDIYDENITRTIAAFSSISEKLEVPSDLRGTALQLFKTINAWALYTREDMWDRIGYDGPQVERYPWRKDHNHKLGWKDG